MIIYIDKNNSDYQFVIADLYSLHPCNWTETDPAYIRNSNWLICYCEDDGTRWDTLSCPIDGLDDDIPF